MRSRIIFATAISFAVIVAALGGAWYLLHQHQTKICPFSGRVIHPQTRTFVTVGGKEYETCCARCAIIEAQQTGKSFHLLKVANFQTDKMMNPKSAWFVEGSSVNYCMRSAPATESAGRETTYIRAFDRCSPSIMAFPSEKDARAFIERNGGALKRLSDLEHEATSSDSKVQEP